MAVLLPVCFMVIRARRAVIIEISYLNGLTLLDRKLAALLDHLLHSLKIRWVIKTITASKLMLLLLLLLLILLPWS